MRPPSGRSNPAIIRSSVVLPQPEGPSSVKNSPASMARLTPSTAVNSPKRRVTFWISSSAIADGLGPFRRWRIVAKEVLQPGIAASAAVPPMSTDRQAADVDRRR